MKQGRKALGVHMELEGSALDGWLASQERPSGEEMRYDYEVTRMR